ncbi:MAG: phosphoribosylaminoimidazolesuccinocarboxamide synthase [Bacteroidales bacterium]|nr:phosphoribosylaminoimidazolesuccinocarboxamide synthase [Bacteroidales bacterium]
MKKTDILHEGKAKVIYATDSPKHVILAFKDDASAYFGIKKSSIQNKGILSNKISEIIFTHLAKNGVKTHFIQRLNDREQLCLRTTPLPLEFIVRNVIAGSLSRRLDIKEGTVPQNTIFEICLKNDLLRDPMINRTHVTAIGITNDETLDKIKEIIQQVNAIMVPFFKSANINLIDFKLEFGVDAQGEILLIDEISPETARLWECDSQKILDSDLFRRDLGNVEESYTDILNRLQTNI